MDAARGYNGSEGEDDDQLMTPIRPSAKALGKRRAEIDTPIDNEELGESTLHRFEDRRILIRIPERREEAEMEQAVMLSTIAPGAETLDQSPRTIQYIYDAAAERALELDALEREERMRRMQTRSSMQRVHPSAGGGSAGSAGGAASVAPVALSSVSQPPSGP